MKRFLLVAGLGLAALGLSACATGGYHDCFASAEAVEMPGAPELLYTSAAAADDDKGRQREYRRERTRRSDSYRRRDPYYGGYGDRRRPYGC